MVSLSARRDEGENERKVDHERRGKRGRKRGRKRRKRGGDKIKTCERDKKLRKRKLIKRGRKKAWRK